MKLNMREEERIEVKVLSSFLKWSVIVSASIIAIGICILIGLSSTGYGSPNICLLLGQIKDPSAFPSTVFSVLTGLMQAKSFAIIQLGILFLIASPFIRLLLQTGIYVKEKDRTFTFISSIVFAFLIVSIILPSLIRM